MAAQSPTIEQNSQFSAKTEQGEDVEFNTSLKFYIDPAGDVKVTVVGNSPQEESSRPAQVPREVPIKVEPSPSEEQPKFKVKEEPSSQSEKPSRSETPPRSEKPCSMPNFNPCRGINDGVKAVKKFYSSYFCDEKKKKSNKPGKNVSSEKEEGFSESEDEVLDKEEKYEM